MARTPQSRGICVFCNRELSKSGLTRHLKTCPERLKLNAEEDQLGGTPETLFHLQVQDAWGGYFWLHLEMKGSATLKDLDYYLRAIWLECCGHMSRFSIGGWAGDEIPMSRKISQVFQPGVELTHIYDFGTSSETLVKAVAVRKGQALTDDPIYLMGRNIAPPATCMECEEPATWLCLECVYEHDENGYLCEAHAEDHPHDAYGEPMPLVNSPRCGMCGYYGPAEPPY
ncbi:MAG TPA: hypothetical protein ENN14_01715 [Chloroflexi bacterium]|nr:hypothetical protein [Chloroflexota bacterium]